MLWRRSGQTRAISCNVLRVCRFFWAPGSWHARTETPYWHRRILAFSLALLLADEERKGKRDKTRQWIKRRQEKGYFNIVQVLIKSVARKKNDHFQTWSNIVQHLTKGWPNVCNMLRAVMLHYMLGWNAACVRPGLNLFHTVDKSLTPLVAQRTEELFSRSLPFVVRASMQCMMRLRLLSLSLSWSLSISSSR